MRTALVAIVMLVLVAGCKTRADDPTARAPEGSASAGEPAPDEPSRRDPHPDYPTPLAAGTDKIFTLEDPDRGEAVAPTFDTKALMAGLTWTTHAHCVADIVDVVCSERATPANWRVGRKGQEIVVAIPKSPIHDTHVYRGTAAGTPRRHVEIDPYGRVRSASLYQGDRYTTRRRDGSNGLPGCGAMAYELDRERRGQRVRCLQWSGEPMRDTSGVAAIRFVRDARGFVSERHFEGLDGKPIASIDGYAAKTYELDREGRVTVVRYRGVDGKPIASTAGCHASRYAYHPTNAVSKETCLDARDAPVEATNGVATQTNRIDPRGCRAGWRYFDASGTPIVDDDQLHGANATVDTRCARTSLTCVGLAQRPVVCGIERPAKYVTRHDAHGNEVSIKHYSPDGDPAADNEYGVFELRYAYDDLDRAIGESCHDVDGSPIVCGTTEIHATRSIFDAAGRIVEERFFGTDGQPAANLGTSIRRFVYDNYDHQYEETNHDINGDLMEMRGQAARRDLYDAAHRTFGIIMLDRSGGPAMYEGCYTGVTCPSRWHAVRIVRRADGRAEHNVYFDQDGQLIYTVNCWEAQCFD